MIEIVLAINTSQSALTGLWITLGVILLFIAYKLLLRRFKRDIPDYSSFIVLNPLEMNPASGELEFYFTTEQPQIVTFIVKSEKEDFSKVLLDKKVDAGAHIIRFDSTQVANGRYAYEVKTNQQQTMKFFDLIN